MSAGQEDPRYLHVLQVVLVLVRAHPSFSKGLSSSGWLAQFPSAAVPGQSVMVEAAMPFKMQTPELNITSLLTYSNGHNKSQGQPRLKGQGNSFHLFVGPAAKLHCGEEWEKRRKVVVNLHCLKAIYNLGYNDTLSFIALQLHMF